jgi:Fe-S-cluster containining protein
MDGEITPIPKDARFRFACTPQVPCFNACCRNLHQVLAPHDILRLKAGLKLSSGEFLASYAIQHTGPQTGLPVVELKPSPDDLACPFVTPEGCRVYPHRPSSCRLYPLARGVSRNRMTGRVSEHFALIREPHCLGFQQQERQTVRNWLQGQDVIADNFFSDLFLELIHLKNRLRPGPLKLAAMRLFQLALYDLDGFREHLLHKGLADDMRLGPETLGKLANDDTALLRFGHEFVKRNIFGQSPEENDNQ